MRISNKWSRFAAGILSLSLAAGAFGVMPSAVNAEKSAVSAYDEDEDIYEYTLKNMSIVSVDTEPYAYNLVVSPIVDGESDPFSAIRITFDDAFVLEDYDHYVKSYGEDFEPLQNWKQTLNFLDLLKEGMTADIVMTSKEDYGDTLSEEKLASGYIAYGETFEMQKIVSVSSPDISIYGDINDDGVVDTFDTVVYRAELAGTNKTKLTDTQFRNGDINRNSEIDEDDLMQVADFILGKSGEFDNVGKMYSKRLDDLVSIDAEKGKITDKTFADAEMNFGVELLKKCFDPTKSGEENLLISPLSISSALAMTANGADNNTLAEMEKLLGNGMSLDDINKYMAYYLSNLPDEKKEKLCIANSIWFRDDPTFKVYDDFLNQNKKFYGSEIYQTEFSDKTVSDVNGWVNRNTNGMIPKLLEKGALDTTDEKIMMMMLINTLYFEAEWTAPYYYSTDGEFTDLNGNKHSIKRLDSKETYYYDLGDADAFEKSYGNGDYKFVGILPREKSITEYISGLDAKKLAEGLRNPEDPEKVDVYTMIPKFTYDYSKSLKDVLTDLGMADAFDLKKADFSKINDLSVEGASPLYIDDVLHKTRIELNEKGTKAAAVTAVMMAAGCSMPEPKKEVHIELDKPFVYMILDKNNLPLFIGAATQLEE